MKFENTNVYNFESAIRGMRHPLESYSKSDSLDCEIHPCEDCPDIKKCSTKTFFRIGEKDLALMQKLIRAGSEHRKFMRQIMLSVEITAPLFWWKEFDTYKIGVTENSTSTMHKLASTPITLDCFEMDAFENFDLYRSMETNNTLLGYWKETICILEKLRLMYNDTKDKIYWKELIRLLPESWLQTRTVTMNYENVLSMIKQRKNHKLTEWSVSFIEWAKTLPYAEELLFLSEKEDKV